MRTVTPTRPRPTYSEIAKVANVSSMTVCNVMRGRACVSSEKRERVLEALGRLGVSASVVRQVAGKGDRRRRTKSFLLLESGFQKGALSSPVYSELARGIGQRCAENGWSLQVCYAQNALEIEEAAKTFNGSGVFLLGPSANFTPFRRNDRGMHAVRLLGSDIAEEGLDRVGYDDEQVGRIAGEWLQRRGCRRPIFIGSASRTRSDAFAAYCRAAGVETRAIVSDRLFQTRQQLQVIDAEVLSSLWREAEEFQTDGVFAFSDQLAAALYNLLYRIGRLPGRETPVISCNREEPFLATLHPRPASIDIHAKEIGMEAVAMLLWRLDNPHSTPKRTILSPSLVEGHEVESAA